MTQEALAAAPLRLNLPKNHFPFFIPLLQGGVQIGVRVGCSLAALLGEQFGLSPDYVRDRIKTVFLEGKPVDDLDRTPVRDGSVLALSAALPGLAGATLRRGGRLAVMRSSITFREILDPAPQSEGFITLKLFNLLLPELGPGFLRRGIYLPREELETFLRGLPDHFWSSCQEAKLGGRDFAEGEFRGLEWLAPYPRFFLSVEFPP